MEVWQVMEAVGAEPGKPRLRWRIQVIKAGVSKNGRDYPLEVLHADHAKFNGAKIYVRTEREHHENSNISAKSVAGWLSDARPNPGGVEAIANISAAESWLGEKIGDAFDRGMPGLIGFSAVMDIMGTKLKTGGREIARASRISKVRSVDAIVNPSAGGEVLCVAESINTWEDDPMDRAKLIKAIESVNPGLAKKLSLDSAQQSDEQFMGIVAEALTPTEPPAEKKAATPPAAATVDMEALKATIAEAIGGLKTEFEKSLVTLRGAKDAEMFDRLFAESKLPAEARGSVRARIPADKGITVETVAEAIGAERSYLAKHAPFKGPRSSYGDVDVTLDQRDKQQAALDGFFMGVAESEIESGGKKHKVKAVRSIRGFYQDLTGDERCTGEVADAWRVAEAELEAGTFAEMLRDAMHKSVQREYGLAPFNQWRAIADVTSVSDFRTNYRPQVGGFGALASVSEKGAYVAFDTTPTDFAPYYTVTKYGRLQTITLEMIVNDDVALIQRIPRKIARAAARTLNTNAWAPILTNANTSWESGPAVALCAAGHGNITTDALSPDTISAGRLAMMKQVEPNSLERLNIAPRWLAVSVDQQQEAFEYCYTPSKPLQAQTGEAPNVKIEAANTPNFFNTFNLEPLVIPHATDTNNSWLLADKADVPILEVGFLNGREEPELFLADQPTVGSMFTNDMLIYKVRHIYGVVALDYRGVYFFNVA